MPTHIGLLRAVNLAGRNMVAMADLRTMIGTLGLADARTLLQSGNVVFTADGASASTAELERHLEQGAEAHLGVRPDFFVRSAPEWQAVIAANPFPGEAERDPGHLLVMFLKEALQPAAVAALQHAIVGREVVKANGRQAYVVYPDGVGRSRLTNALIEKHLGTRATGRNWNTVLKLGTLVENG